MDKVLGFLIVLVLLYGVYNAQKADKTKPPKSIENCTVCKIEEGKLHLIEKELTLIETTSYVRQYIENVIEHGSYTLGFSGGVMEGGFAQKEDISRIACYVLELSGKRCEEPYEKDAQMFYTSICGGCHGDDGKGLKGGNYPDLTRKKLLGIAVREEYLRSKLAKLKKEELHHHDR